VAQALPVEAFSDLEFSVMKINNLRENGHNRAQPRVLRLTAFGLDNAKRASGDDPEMSKKYVTKSHSYTDVLAVYLTAVDRFCVDYINDHKFVYRSMQAPVIVIELRRRISAIKFIERVSLQVPFTPDSLKEASSVFHSRRASTFLARIVRESMPDVPGSAPIRPEFSPSSPPPQERASTKLTTTTGNNVRERIYEYVQRVFFMEKSTEGAVLKQFIQSESQTVFSSSSSPEEKLDFVKRFVDGLLEYFIEHREQELIRDVIGYMPRRERSSQRIIDARSSTGSGVEAQGGAAVVEPPKEDVDDNLLFEDITRRLREALEAAVVFPIKEAIWKCLPSQKEEAQLLAYIGTIETEPQAFFGVKPEHVSPEGWKAAVYELGRLVLEPLPSVQLEVLITAARAIHFEHEQRNETQLSADDFLPIFIFVVVKAKNPSPLRLCRWLYSLGDSSMLQSEAGYYLTMYEASFEHLKSQVPETMEPSASYASQNTSRWFSF